MKKIIAISFSITLLYIATGCKNFLKDATEIQAVKDDAIIQTYIKTQPRYNFVKFASGAYYAKAAEIPAGQAINIGDQVTFYYKLYLLQGGLIDSVAESKKEAAVAIFNGSSQLTNIANMSNVSIFTPGLTEGVAFTKVGERSITLIPSGWALGTQPVGSLIPANSCLRADVKVLSSKSEWIQVEEYLANYLKINPKLTVTKKTTDGLSLIRTAAGTGDSVKTGLSVTVNYTGYFLDGKSFDSGSFSFVPGLKIPETVGGFDKTVLSMKIGEKVRTVFPSALGYGKTGRNAIKGYMPLVFDIEVVKQATSAN